MCCKLPLSLVALLFFATPQTTALSGFRSSLASLVPWETSLEKRQLDNSNFETEKNGSEFLWLIQDTYEGQSFFE